jgi:hypothetical protein
MLNKVYCLFNLDGTEYSFNNHKLLFDDNTITIDNKKEDFYFIEKSKADHTILK